MKKKRGHARRRLGRQLEYVACQVNCEKRGAAHIKPGTQMVAERHQFFQIAWGTPSGCWIPPLLLEEPPDKR